MSDYVPGDCPGCGTPMVNTGGPIWEDLCPNDACTWQADEFKRDLAASARARKERERLRDAAPDLLAALQGILAITDRKHAAWDKAHAAIAKAAGR